MEVDDDVGDDAVLREGHVLLRQDGADDAGFWPMRLESLSPTMGVRVVRNLDLGDARSVVVDDVEHRVDDAPAVSVDDGGLVALHGPPRPLPKVRGRDGVEMRTSLGRHPRPPPPCRCRRRGSSCCRAVRKRWPTLPTFLNRSASKPPFWCSIAVRLVLYAPEHSPFQCGLVDDDAVLLILSRVAHDGHDGVDSGGGVR